jgi:hypothetical protein
VLWVVLSDVPVAPAAAVVVGEVVGAEVVEEGSTSLSKDTEVPEAQFTGLPPTACQVLPVT